MTKDSIFISFAQPKTGKIAETLTTMLNQLYSNKDHVSIYYSNSSISPGENFVTNIEEGLRNASCGICLISPENTMKDSRGYHYASPWLMYEAGALTLSTKQKNGIVVPYLFCLSPEEFKSPFKETQSISYQIRHPNNMNELIRMIAAVNKCLDEKNRVSDVEIDNAIQQMWNSKNYKDIFERMAKDIEDISATSYGDKVTRSEINESLSLRTMASLETSDQDIISGLTHYDSAIAKTPRELVKQFESILETQVPKTWVFQNEDDAQFKAHRVIVNNTRFSTFVAFTDGIRIVLFDRKKGKDNTNVYNDRFDVFGSVQFENRTLVNKLKSSQFLDAPILKIEDITGVAVENNFDKFDSKIKETAVMLGLCVTMKPEDLDLAIEDAPNGEIIIRDTRRVFDEVRDAWTSKASLSISHILSKQQALSNNENISYNQDR